MKAFKAALLLVLVLFFAFMSAHAFCMPQPSQASKVALWLVLRFRDYGTDMPISNMSVKATVYAGWGQTINIGPALTNETGIIKVFAGNITRPSTLPQPPKMRQLELSNNYTLIKVQATFIEDTEYTAEWQAGTTRYTPPTNTQLQINLDQRNLENSFLIEGNFWLLKGKLVKVSDYDPTTGQRATTLSMKPAVKTLIASKIGEYENYYLFPLRYKTTISSTLSTYPPLQVEVDENTTFINWMYHAEDAYVKSVTSSMDTEIAWISSSGYSLEREVEEYQAVKSLLNRILDFYQRREYSSAVGGAKLSASRLASLQTWFQNIKFMAVLTSLSISLFSYGLASLFSNLVFEEPSQSKIRLASKIVIFSTFMLVFSLTHPSIKMTSAMITGSRSVYLPITLLGWFIMVTVTYFFFTLIGVKRTPMTGLSMQLGIRSLKRRLSRTLLTLVTITLIVSSAIIFVNVSTSRASRIRDSWKGTDIPAVLVKPDIAFVPLTEYDVNWTRSQVWCEDLGYSEVIRTPEVGEQEIVRLTLIQLGTSNATVYLEGIDPVFMEKYYGLPNHIRGLWQEFSPGENVVILPTTYNAPPNTYVTLIVEDYLVTDLGAVLIGRRTLGDFRVVGSFDPSTLANLTKMDNTPLFVNTLDLVLVPIKTVVEQSLVVSEIEILIKEGYDPVNVADELAYTFGVSTVANKDGVAKRIEWSLELSIIGLVPSIPPLAIAGLMMYVTMLSVYEERRREFIMLATLGLDPKNTFQVFLVEALLLGFMGTFLGFFGSYMVAAALFYIANFLAPSGLPISILSLGHWSMPAILVAFFTGVVMVFLGGYVPAKRTQALSLMGRVKRRQLVGELITSGNTTRFTLPIRETIQNSEMLYTYVRETIGRFDSSLVDPHSVKGEIRGDGSFTVSFISLGSSQSVLVPCEVKGIREGESLVPVIEFPARFKDYFQIRQILRDLEEHMIGFAAWKETQLKMKIVREAPKERKTIEEVLSEIRMVIDEIKAGYRKLKILEAQRGKLSEEVYNEFRPKYVGMIEEKSKALRAMAIGLEPYYNELQEEIKKVGVEIERITTAYSLGEIGEEEYVKTCGPLQGRLAMLKGKVAELEEISEFLKKPLTTA